MPMYDYQCPGCSHQFELRQSFNAEPLAFCPLCESVSRRVFHPVPVIYKGTGFYTTDYARKPVNGNSNGKENKSGPDASSKVPASTSK